MSAADAAWLAELGLSLGFSPAQGGTLEQHGVFELLARDDGLGVLLDVDGGDSTPPPPPEDDVPEPPVFEVDKNFRVLPVTYPGCLPRLATGCNEGTVIDFDFATQE